MAPVGPRESVEVEMRQGSPSKAEGAGNVPHANGRADYAKAGSYSSGVAGSNEQQPGSARGNLARLSVRTSRLTGSPRKDKSPAANGHHHAAKPSVVSVTDDTALLLPRGEMLSSDDEMPLSPALPIEQRRHPISALKRWYMVAVFTVTAAMLYADQNLLAPNLTMIADEFGMDPRERDTYLGGIISGAFFAVGAPSAIFLGWASDKYNRRNLLFLVVLLGEGPCLATYWVQRYWQLLLVRLLTGISFGGTLPILFSLIGDLFWEEHRAYVAAGIQIATGVGLAVGQGVAGFSAPAIGWRWPFIIVAIPAICMAFLMLFTVPEPPRGVTEDAIQKHCDLGESYVYKEKITWRKMWRVISTPSNLCCIGQGLPGSLPWGVILTFFNDYLVQEQHRDIGIAASVLMVFGVGGGVGVFGGGLIGQLLYNKRKRVMPLFVGVCVMIAAIPMLWVVNASLWKYPWYAPYVPVFLGGMLASPPGPNARAMLLNVNEPETRGIALGMMTVMDDCGRGLGPLLVAAILNIFHGVSRLKALNLVILGWVPAGFVFGLSSLFIVKDVNDMHERMRDVALRQAEILPPLAPEDEASALSTETTQALTAVGGINTLATVAVTTAADGHQHE